MAFFDKKQDWWDKNSKKLDPNQPIGIPPGWEVIVTKATAGNSTTLTSVNPTYRQIHPHLETFSQFLRSILSI